MARRAVVGVTSTAARYAHDMSTRLQVVVTEEELRAMKSTAQAAHLTLSEWVRQSLRHARNAAQQRLDDEMLDELLGQATSHRFPAPDIETMNAEIVRGYLAG